MKTSDLKPMGVMIVKQEKQATLILVVPGEVEILPGVALIGHEPVGAIVASQN